MEAPILPQQPSDERVEIDSVEWLFAPDWPGRRLIASLADGTVRLTDAAAAPATDLAAAIAVLERAIGVTSAVLDGVWTELAAEEGRSTYVAIDLLELDGESLLDVPFQERRRLLESVVAESAEVRVSPAVKQPVAGWLAGWRQAGFTHYLARHQNARYVPGGRSDDWLRIPIEAAPEPGLLRRVIGVRGTRPRRIR